MSPCPCCNGHQNTACKLSKQATTVGLNQSNGNNTRREVYQALFKEAFFCVSLAFFCVALAFWVLEQPTSLCTPMNGQGGGFRCGIEGLSLGDMIKEFHHASLHSKA